MPAPSLLACVQRDIAAVFDRAADEARHFALADADDSLRVHDCHSPQRELEVVRDQIHKNLAARRQFFLELPPGVKVPLTISEGVDFSAH